MFQAIRQLRVQLVVARTRCLRCDGDRLRDRLAEWISYVEALMPRFDALLVSSVSGPSQPFCLLLPAGARRWRDFCRVCVIFL